MTLTTLHLSKQNFKFSAAHFLIFDEKNAEKLHGHNYQVEVDIECPAESEFQKAGYFIDFNVFKKLIKARLDEWDEHILLPQNHHDMKCKENQILKNYEVQFRDRFYSFPQNEVIWLPVTNTSVEQLSRLLAENFYKQFQVYGVQSVKVSVEETRGQSASVLVRAEV